MWRQLLAFPVTISERNPSDRKPLSWYLSGGGVADTDVGVGHGSHQHGGTGECDRQAPGAAGPVVQAGHHVRLQGARNSGRPRRPLGRWHPRPRAPPFLLFSLSDDPSLLLN